MIKKGVNCSTHKSSTVIDIFKYNQRRKNQPRNKYRSVGPVLQQIARYRADIKPTKYFITR